MKISSCIVLLLISVASLAQTPALSSASDTLAMQAKDFQEIQEKDSTQTVNPWQQKKGELLLSPFVSHYRATSFRDSDGNRQDFNNNGKFTNYNPRLYFSLALNDTKLNLFGSIPFFSNRYQDDENSLSNTDFGDIELGLRFNLANWGENYLMGAVIGYFPAYSNNQLPFASFERYGIEPRLILGGTSKWLGEFNNFHKIELGLRYFFPKDPIQFRLLLTEGYNLTNKLLLLGEVDVLMSYSEESQFFEENLQLVSDFKMIKASINLGYRFSEKVEVYGGLFHDLYNRNIAVGSGFQLFGVIRID